MARKLKGPTCRSVEPIDNDRWQAIVARDATADGTFYYSVATTGVYCCPSCASRLPRRENVVLHRTSADAEAAGFRPCKRCRPNAASHDAIIVGKIATACKAIESADSPPSLSALALAAGLSPFHFHRVFKASVGVTPKAYAIAHRGKRLRDTLASHETVTAAMFDAGYNSSGRFYADVSKTLGMAPVAYKSGGLNTSMKFAVGACSLGAILVAATDKGVSAVLMGDDADALIADLQHRFPNAALIGGDKKFDALAAKVIALVENPSAPVSLPLDVRGTAFQCKVWTALQAVPAGKTASYSAIAKAIGLPKSARAVALACGANPAAVIIPCHRVVRTGGALSGYRWGIARKRALLDREAAGTSSSGKGPAR